MNVLHVIESLSNQKGGAATVVPQMCIAIKRTSPSTCLRISSLEYPESVEDLTLATEMGVDIKLYPRRGGIAKRLISYSHDFCRGIVHDVEWADCVHIHGLWEYPVWKSALTAQKQRKPYLMMPHGSLEPERLKKGRLKKEIVSAILDRKMMNNAEGVLATAEREAESIRLFGVKSKISVVGLGIDSAKYGIYNKNATLLSNLGANPAKKHVLYFSRIAKIKGLDFLAEAWGAISLLNLDWELLIVGPDSQGYKSECLRLFNQRCRKGSFLFCEPVFGDDKISLLSSVDLFVLPTKSENFSIAVAEALASRIPVVCTKGAPWGVIEEYGAGLWVDVSALGIKEGLLSMMKKTKEELTRIGIYGRRCVEELFDWQAVAHRIYTIYSSVLTKQPKK